MLAPLGGRSARPKVIGVLLGAALVTALAAPAQADAGDPVPVTVSADAGVVTLPIGDGFNDSESVTITAAADLTADVNLTSPSGDVTTVASGIDFSAGQSTPVVIPTDGLTAGSYTVEIVGTSASADASTTFVVGSGDAATLNLQIPAASAAIYPYQTPTVQATVSATDETGTALPLTGSLTATDGSTTTTTPLPAESPFTYSLSGLPLGTATLTATATTPAGTTITSAGVALQLDATDLTSLSVGRSLTTVYPVKDGYRDSVTFTVTSHTASTTAAPVTGTATLKRGGTTAVTWSVHAGTQHLVWNGLLHSKVVTGTYTLTVTAKGPQGAGRTVHTSVVVSGKRTVTRTIVVKKAASSVLTAYRAYDQADKGYCAKFKATVGCLGYDADASGMSLIAVGYAGVPSAVRSSTSIAAPRVRVTVHATRTSGTALWGYGIGAKSSTGHLTAGNHSGSWVSWSGNPSQVLVSIGLTKNSSAIADRFVLTYQYKILR